MLGARLYGTIGRAYTATRRTDPRIAAQIRDALGDARTVLNVGAGTGSYEPADRDVTAVEPSAVMREQRPPGSARCVAATAESLPFEDHSFDVALAVSTVHHWADPMAGLREMRRVAHQVVMSVWTKVGSAAEERAVRSLRADLDSGRWAERNGDLADLDAADLGLRLLIA
jgi:ubiquinone/menaquinone biosynthesis C-methylase UbiE